MKFQLKVKTLKSNLKIIRDFVLDSLNQSGGNIPDKDLIVLAVDEVCANKIIHSNKNDNTKELEVIITFKKHELLFDIIDQGSPFNASSYTEPNIRSLVKNKSKGPIGMLITQKIMDDIQFTQNKSFNKCRMIKKITS